MTQAMTPVELTVPEAQINWYEVAALANAMSVAEGRTPCFTCEGEGDFINCDFAVSSPYECDGYRMPTETEWEYAAQSWRIPSFLRLRHRRRGRLVPLERRFASARWPTSAQRMGTVRYDRKHL